MVPDIWNGVASGVGSLAGGVLGFLGQERANSANARMAREANEFGAEQSEKQMRFQERMSNSAYQRAVDDLRKAGLNPALAWMQGGASSPGGASSSAQVGKAKNSLVPLGEGVSRVGSSAVSMMRSLKEFDQLDASIGATKAAGVASLASAQKDSVQAKATKLGLGALGAEAGNRARKAEFDSAFVEMDSTINRIMQILGGASSAVGAGRAVERVLSPPASRSKSSWKDDRRHFESNFKDWYSSVKKGQLK